jgi:hypothetical protein
MDQYVEAALDSKIVGQALRLPPIHLATDTVALQRRIYAID